MTEQDAATALGTASGPGKSATAPGGTRCVYDDGALIVFTDARGKTAFDQGHTTVQSEPAGTWADVRNLGDGAFISHSGPIASVEFYKGSTMVAIILSGSSPTASVAAALTVARAAASRL